MAALEVPAKKTWEVYLAKPLRGFIQTTFEGSNPDDYNHALTEFDKLRNQVITKVLDKHESSLEVLYRYYDQLVAIESKLPIAENQIRITFKWQDAFDKGSFLAGKATLAISSAQYEKVCVLFNIAALQSQVAAVQNPDDDDGLKLAAKLYQQSSGIFRHLKDSVLSSVQQDPTPDLYPDILNALHAIMLAQGQESIYKKASKDKMKPAVVAKIANQCSEFFAEALKLTQLYTAKEVLPKEWVSAVAGKQAAYHGLAEYYSSLVAKEKKCYGEEIARLKHGVELLRAAETRGGSSVDFSEVLTKLTAALAAAEKDNNFIYHDTVPDVKTLQPIGKAALAKPLPLAAPMCSRFQDLFEKLVPLAVHEGLVSFDNRKSAIVNMEVGRLRVQTQLLNSVLASLNLPAAIEDVSGNQLPSSLAEKARTLQSEGGIVVLNKLMSDLPELLGRNKEILDEAFRLLDEEQKSDDQLKAQFKERWTRTPSIKLTEPIRAEGSKYRTILNNAIQADNVVKEKYNTHKQGFELLSKSERDIEKSLPSASPAAAVQNSQTVKDLRQLMSEVEAIKAEREATEMEIKDAKCDMSSKFLNALAQDGALNEEALSMAELDRIYQPLREQVNESCRRQEDLCNRIQHANDQFCKDKSSNQSAATREAMLRDLAAAYDSFIELKSNLIEGTKFYNDLTQLLVKFQNKVSDLCFARKTEKEELMRDLQTSIASQRSEPAPQPPSYQTPGGDAARRQAPARPPPPSVQPQAPSAPSQPPASQAPPYGGPPATAAAPSGYTPPPAFGAAAPMPSGYNPYAYQQPPQQNYQQQPYGQPGYGQGYGGPYAPAQQGYPQAQQGYPPAQPGYPPQQGYPPAGYPPQQQGYPPQQGGYGQYGGGYQQQPPYPQQQWR